MTEDESRFATFSRAVVLAILAGWLLVIGKGLILPIFAAVISVYVLNTAADAMGRLPWLRRLPSVGAAGARTRRLHAMSRRAWARHGHDRR